MTLEKVLQKISGESGAQPGLAQINYFVIFLLG
jgi:hypothetical protein